jgi:hypothetical protein
VYYSQVETPLPKSASAITVDGRLDEPAWREALRLDLPYEVHPGENLPAPVRTEALLTYDASRFYAAFRASDPDPKAIRARLTDRDTAFLDDFVGLVVDTFNDERRAFEFFVNPMGVQMDLVVDDVAGSEDSSWDAIWESAGALTPDGYLVEMAIPYTSLRFQRGRSAQDWGLDLVRIYPRDRRILLAMNPRDRNTDCYLCQASKISGFDGVSPGRNLEITPTLTVIRSDQVDLTQIGVLALLDRKGPPPRPQRLERGKPDPDLGLTVKYGITPNLTASAAVNPDFSQVEADEAQLAVNEQFALFFPEKRPFFLEMADFFETPVQAVYTRTVADPAWGAKLTGKEGKNALGAFFAQDDVTNLLLPGSQGSALTALEDPATLAVLRHRRDVGKNSAVGALLTARGAEEYFNGVAGVDALLRPTSKDTIRLQFLGSETRYPRDVYLAFGEPAGTFAGNGVRLNYSRSTRNWYAYVRYLDLGAHFRADLGFVPQVDVRLPLAGIEHIWLGDPNDRLTRIGVGGDWDQTTDQQGTLIERETEVWAWIQGPMQTFARVGGGHRLRGFRDDVFDQQFVYLSVETQPAGQVRFGLDGGISQRVDFDFEDPNDSGRARQGHEIRLGPFLRLEPGRHVRVNLSHELRRLALDEGYLFRANLSQLRLAYQVNLRAFFRAILQYADVTRNRALYLHTECRDADPNTFCPILPETRSLFTQLLFSYKINPQTALYVGYTDGQAGLEDWDRVFPVASLSRRDRAFFFKIGRAWVM